MTSRERLRRAAAGVGLQLEERQEDQLLAYLSELLRWNRTYNLTAARDEAQALLVQVIDPVVAFAKVHQHLPAGRMLDLGTGGGVPSLIWKILQPERPIEAWDSVGKKVRFVAHAARHLGLGEFEARQQRVPESSAWFEGEFELVVSRALAPPEKALRLMAPLCTPGGRVVLLAGPEVEACAANAGLVGTEAYALEDGARRGKVLIWQAPS